MNGMTPKTNLKLFGHDLAERSLLDAARRGKLAHGLIIAGPQGIGKATLAYRLAFHLLSGGAMLSIDHPIHRRIISGAHTDLLVIEPEFDSKKGEAAREIAVEQARGIAQFLSLTPGESDWRVVIVDSADALNINAASAILKILEEPPPQSVLVLISHHPATLLATIRSRCQMVKLAPLPESDFRRATQHILPETPDDRIGSLMHMSGASPGLAKIYEEQGVLSLYEQLLELLASVPAIDTLKLHAFADQVTAERTHSGWQLLMQLVLLALERSGKTEAGLKLPALVEGEAEILSALAKLHPAAVWAKKWQQALDQFLLAESRHLDYKQVIIVFFHSIANPESSALGYAA